MPKTKLTDLSVSRLQSGMHWDALLPAFGLRVGESARTFIVIRNGGSRVKIGRYPALSLSQARDAARKLMSGPNVGSSLFQDVLDGYKTKHLTPNCRPRYAAEIERILRAHFPFTKAIQSVTKQDVQLQIDKIEGQSAANHAATAIKMLLIGPNGRTT